MPALCVLGARLINEGDLVPAELANHDVARRDILARFRDELVGRISEQADPAVVRALLVCVAALQPVETATEGMAEWFAEQLGRTTEEVRDAVRGLEQGGLLSGAGRRRRIVPDVLGDHIIREACVGPDGRPTGRADELVALAPDWATSRVLANLAELDWRLGVAGEQSVLDAVRAGLEREILAAGAWDRRQMLERLRDSAVFLPHWMVHLARRVLDHAAEDSEILPGHTITDSDTRLALVPLLRDAGLVPDHTAAAMFLLWEIGRDLQSRSTLSGDDPLEAIQRFGSYELRGPYADTLLEVVERLVGDDEESEQRRALPIKLLSPLTSREGTTSSATGYTVSLGSYFVDATAAQRVRNRLRTLLVDSCIGSGPRTRAAAAQLLGEMLRQPHGFFGRSAPRAAIAQWRPEQLALLADIDSVMHRSDDVVVVSRLRDSMDWHARHSAIRGIKTAVRRLQRSHPATPDELLLRTLTDGFSHFDNYETAQRRLRAIARQLVNESPLVQELLRRIDDMLERLAAGDPETHTDAGRLMATLAERDLDWAMEAARVLVADPARPAARAVGVLLTVVVSRTPARTREIVAELAGAGDVALRRIAADHISRMTWVTDPDSPERRLAATLAADSDSLVVRNVVLAAHRAADHDPEFSRAVLRAVRNLSDPDLAEDVCTVLAHDLGLTPADEAHFLERLLLCPDIGYWQDRWLGSVSACKSQEILRYLLARIDSRDDTGYRAIPFEGLSADPLMEHTELRVACLQQIIEFTAEHLDGLGAYDATTLFWSYAGGQVVGLDAIAHGLTGSSSQTRDAALQIVAHAPHGIVLGNPAWVAKTLDAVSAKTLDEVEGALAAALTTGVKQGSPGKPFPRDVLLRDRAAEHAAAARPGSRPAAFWASVVRMAESDIQRSLEMDEELDDE